MQTRYFAPSIECEGCADSIQKALVRQPGVSQVAVDVPERTVTVEHDPEQVNAEELELLLDAIGFPASAAP